MQNFISSAGTTVSKKSKHNPFIVRRNRSICKHFALRKQENLPTMRIYAELAERFELTQASIRLIVSQTNLWT